MGHEGNPAKVTGAPSTKGSPFGLYASHLGSVQAHWGFMRAYLGSIWAHLGAVSPFGFYVDPSSSSNLLLLWTPLSQTHRCLHETYS